MKIFELTKKQQDAFDELKKAANKCTRLNIGFVNVYGSIITFDNGLIAGFGVDSNYEVPCGEYDYPPNQIDNLGGDSYADDQISHSFKLTPKGKKIFYSESD